MYTLIIKNVKMDKLKINLNIKWGKKDLEDNQIDSSTLSEEKTLIPKVEKSNTTPIKNEIPTSNVEKVSQEDTKKPVVKLNINSIKASSNLDDNNTKKIATKTTDDSIDKKEKIESKKVNLFNNYESVFKKEKFNILEHIKKLKSLIWFNYLLGNSI